MFVSLSSCGSGSGNMTGGGGSGEVTGSDDGSSMDDDSMEKVKL